MCICVTQAFEWMEIQIKITTKNIFSTFHTVGIYFGDHIKYVTFCLLLLFINYYSLKQKQQN